LAKRVAHVQLNITFYGKKKESAVTLKYRDGHLNGVNPAVTSYNGIEKPEDKVLRRTLKKQNGLAWKTG